MVGYNGMQPCKSKNSSLTILFLGTVFAYGQTASGKTYVSQLKYIMYLN